MTGAPRIWVLADDRPGNANQALGVAEALGLDLTIKTIRYGPLARLPNALLGASLLGLMPAARAALTPPWPDLVIAAGRRTAPVVRWIRRRHRATFAVQLMWPGSARDLDLVAVPDHDDVPADAVVLRTLGAPHRLTGVSLLAAAARFEPEIGYLPRPRVACLIGGATRRAPFTPADATAMVEGAAGLAAARGGSLLITTSRRTGTACEDAIAAAALSVPVWLHRFSAGGDNPYLGLLGAADAVVASGDSASMCSEACATGRPVFLYRPAAGVAPKLERLHRRLEELGHLRPLGAPWPETAPPPLLPQNAVADAIRARWPAARVSEAVAARAAKGYITGPDIASAGED